MFAALSGPGETLKTGYSATLRNAFILAISIHVLIFVFFPPFEFKPYALEVPDDPPVVVNVTDFRIPPPPPDVNPLNIVVPIAGDDSGEDVEISPTAVEVFPPPPVLKNKHSMGSIFVPFDAPPELTQ
jgi:hypothetical protein